jgi:hypothetical protein
VFQNSVRCAICSGGHGSGRAIEAGQASRDHQRSAEIHGLHVAYIADLPGRIAPHDDEIRQLAGAEASA